MSMVASAHSTLCSHLYTYRRQLQWLRVLLNIRSMCRRLCAVIVSFSYYGKPVHALNSTPDPTCGLAHPSRICLFLTLNHLNLYQSNGGKNEYSIMYSLVVMIIIYMHTAVV